MKKILLVLSILMCLVLMCVSGVYSADFIDPNFPDRDCSTDPNDYFHYNATDMLISHSGTQASYNLFYVADALDPTKNTGNTIFVENWQNSLHNAGGWQPMFKVTDDGITGYIMSRAPTLAEGLEKVYNDTYSVNDPHYTYVDGSYYNISLLMRPTVDLYNITLESSTEGFQHIPAPDLGGGTEYGMWDHTKTPRYLGVHEVQDGDTISATGIYWWNGTEGCPIDEEVNDPPVVTLVSPGNNHYIANSFDYTYSVSDSEGIGTVESCELWKKNDTSFFLYNNNTEVNETNYILEIVKDNDTSKVNWYVKCYDNESAEGLSSTWTIHIDSKNPIPHFYYPANDNSTTRPYNDNTFPLDVGVENHHLHYVNLTIFNPNTIKVHDNYSGELSDEPGVEYYNMSYSIDSSNKANWLLGIYTVLVNATDYANNSREWTRIFEVVNTAPTSPSIVFTSPDTAYSDSLLVCNASDSTDADGDNITYYYEFKDSDDSTILQAFSEDNTADCGVIEGCDRGDTIYCHAIASDLLANSSEGTPASIYINSKPPTQDKPLLNSSSGTNYTNENLTCYNQSTYDADDDPVTSIFTWFKDSIPLNILSMPFEGGSNSTFTKDYSGYGNNGIVSTAIWKSDGGHDGKGAYDVTENSSTITIPHKASLNPTDEITVMAWLKYNDTYCDSNYGGSAARPIAKGQNEAFELQTYEWTSDCTARFCVNGICPNLGTTSGTTKGNWAHITGSFNGTHINTYFNGDLDESVAYAGEIPFVTDDLIIGDWTSTFGRGFMGIIDEVMIFDYALSEEQIKVLYEGRTDLIVSSETTSGEYICSITPNDGFSDGTTLNSSSLLVVWKIEFNVTSGEDSSYLDNKDINCDYTEFNQGGDTTNLYGPYGFPSGEWVCTFEDTLNEEFFDKIETFTADSDKIVQVVMAKTGGLTYQEHTWLEAIYDCVVGGDCDLYNILLQINETVDDIWEHTSPTDESVVTTETITNDIVNSTHNLTIDYTVYIPIKAGYSLGDYLPVRIGYWFLDENNTTCYNQGDQPTGVADPYCQPLIIETMGPMGDSVSFSVNLQPTLPEGDYSIKRSIDIDPLGVWYNYGQEEIGEIIVTEDIEDYGVSVDISEETLLNQIKETKDDGVNAITGAVTGVIDKVSPTMMAITGMVVVICLVLAGFVGHYRAKSKK